MSVAVWPPGQSNVVAGGETVRLPVTDPFLTLNVPPEVTGDWVVVFFASLGIWPPPFTQESTRVAVADAR